MISIVVLSGALELPEPSCCIALHSSNEKRSITKPPAPGEKQQDSTNHTTHNKLPFQVLQARVVRAAEIGHGKARLDASSVL